MKTLTTTSLATLPRVNLLPPEIHERRRLQRLQIGLGAVVVLSVFGVGFMYMSGQSAVTTAKARVADAQNTQTKLSAQIQKLQYVTQTRSAKDAAEAALTQATASEIHWSDYLADMSVVVPPGVWVTQLSFVENVQPGSLTNPTAAPPTVGTVTVTATTLPEGGAAHNGVASWLDATVKEKGFSSPWYGSSTESYIGPQKVATFASNINVTSDALTKRCIQPGVC